MPIIIAIIVWFALVTAGQAANFSVVEESGSGAWTAALFENDSSGQRFCAVESQARSPVFRLNRYLSDGDTFVELFDPAWSKMEGAVTFALVFSADGSEPITMQLRGWSWGDSYTYDVLEKDVFVLLQGLLSSSSTMNAVNSNGAMLATFDLEGAASAVRTFNECLSP